MAISLQDVKEKNQNQSDSLLDIILRRKEKKLIKKGNKRSIQRPWDKESKEQTLVFKDQSKVMKPFDKEPKKFDEKELIDKIQKRARALFTNLSL